MTYSLFFRSPALPYAQKQTPINVPAGSVVSNATSLRFTGKGATNYGKIQQENLIRLLEHFAGDTAPDNPTVGQIWFDTAASVLKVCSATTPVSATPTWEPLNAMQVTGVGEPPPASPSIGDTWFSITGSQSGVMYVYTGVGRYPQKDWSALTSGYWPGASTAATARLNASSFAAVGSNWGDLYVHGFTGATPADVNGSILVNGTTTTLPKGACNMQAPVTDGLLVWDRSGTMIAGSGTSTYFCVHQFNNGRWYYDNNITLVEFEPNGLMYAIGRVTNGEQDDQTSPGVLSAVIWSSAPPLSDLMQVQATAVGGAIGGWEQVWPVVETYGGRAEYEYLYGQLMSLIGSPYLGGSGAEGRAIQNLTNFKTLDASLQLAWATVVPSDYAVFSPVTARNKLKVDTNSQDWDKLFSACRYAVNRLELPAGMVADLAVHPFVQDGLPADPSVYAISGTDIRSLPEDRRYRNRVGAITILSEYQETVNVLRAAVQNRYLLKGILANSGVGNALPPTVIAENQAQFTAAAGSFSGTVQHGLRYQFDATGPNIERFFFSGATIQVVFTHLPGGSPTAADVALQSIANAAGRIRISADNTFVMTPSPTPSLAQAPAGVGFNQMTAGGVVLASMTSGSTTVTIRGLKSPTVPTAGLAAPIAADIYVDVTGGGTLSGTFQVTWSYIFDDEQFSNPGATNVYPKPLAYNSAHKLGSSLYA